MSTASTLQATDEGPAAAAPVVRAHLVASNSAAVDAGRLPRPRWRASATTQPTHRRRQRWFEANPGCFSRASVGALAVAGALGGGVWLTWRWRLKGMVVGARLARAAWKFARRRRGG